MVLLDLAAGRRTGYNGDMEFTSIVEGRPSVWKFDCMQPRLTRVPKRVRPYVGARHNSIAIIAEYISARDQAPAKLTVVR